MDRERNEILQRIVSREKTDVSLIKKGNDPIFVHCAMDAVMYKLICPGEYKIKTSHLKVPIDLDADSNILFSYVGADDIEKLTAQTSESDPSPVCSYLRVFEGKEDFEDWKKNFPKTDRDKIQCISSSEAFEYAKAFVDNIESK